MDCVCCGTELVRGRDLPETRGWLRPGDRFCRSCEWVYPRELIGEGEPLVSRCRVHLRSDDGRPAEPAC